MGDTPMGKEQTVAEARFRLIQARGITRSDYNWSNQDSRGTAESGRAVPAAEAGAELGEAEFHGLAVLTLARGFGFG